MYHNITVYLLWEFALQSCQLQVPTAHLLYLKKPGTNLLLCCVVQGSGAPEPGSDNLSCAAVCPTLCQLSQEGARQGLRAPSALAWQGKGTRAEWHIPTEMAPIWYLSTKGWHGHLETRCVENKATELPWPTLICCFIAACVLLIFYFYSKRCGDVRG